MVRRERTEDPVPNSLEFDAFLEEVEAEWARYVNRRSTNPPSNLTNVGLSMWLMLKEDGTSMGRSAYLSCCERVRSPDVRKRD